MLRHHAPNTITSVFQFYFLCTVCQNGDIRLQGGANSNQGRVEVCNENRWGSVCDDAFGTIDASVACRQLGFDAQGKQLNRITL